ncbi:hypothetical protein [Variovorax sp. LjRoot178]|uniref:hypothetical protein n=1 Tax=Variovorax sp. LjRoot178 TaxID=3342277 RepID=UPI003F518F57
MEYGDETFPFAMTSARHWQRINAAVQLEPVQGSHCYMQQTPAAAAERIRAFLLDA